MGRRSNNVGRIYALCDPDTGEIRYVGKTTEVGRDRLNRHLRESVKSKTWVANWIRSLGGKEPEFRILEVTSREEAAPSEIRWIKKLRESGCRLTNLTDGGDGQLGFSPSEETRKKIGSYHKGKIVSAETRAKQSKAARNRSLQAKAAQAARLRAYLPTIKDKARMAESQKRRFQDPAALEKQKIILRRALEKRWAQHRKEENKCLLQAQI